MIEQFKNFFDAQREAVITEAALNQFRALVAGLNNTECKEALFYVLKGDVEDENLREKSASVECVRLLMEIGVTTDARDGSNCSPLSSAVSYGYRECTRLLIDHGANPSEVDSEDISLLEDAVRLGRIGCVELLLERGADLNHSGPEYGGVFEILHDFQSGNAELESLLTAAWDQVQADLTSDESDSDDESEASTVVGVGDIWCDEVRSDSDDDMDDIHSIGDATDTGGDMQD